PGRSCPDESKVGCFRQLSLAALHLRFDRVESRLGDSHLTERVSEIAPALRTREMLLDHLREGLTLALLAREEGVGLHVDRDRLHGHALIVHLCGSAVKVVRKPWLPVAARSG